MTAHSPVVVTGASGFIATHCIVKLIAAGYCVRGTLRTPERADEVRAAVSRGLGRPADAGELTFATADLTKDAGWAEVVDGCDYVMHIASPLPRKYDRVWRGLRMPPMKQYHTEIVIDAPLVVVWEVLTDFSTYPQSNPLIGWLTGDFAPRRSSDRQLRRGATYVMAIAANAAEEKAVSLTGPEAYLFTAHCVREIAAKVIGGEVAAGFRTPAWYGKELLDAMGDVEWL